MCCPSKWLVVGSILSIVIGFLVMSAYLGTINTHPTMVHGYGPHLVIMIHGVMGTPLEFMGIAHMFDESKYTVLIPSIRNSHTIGVRSSAIRVLNEFKTFMEGDSGKFPRISAGFMIYQWKIKESMFGKIKKLSIIGNSMGGLVAKDLLYVLFQDPQVYRYTSSIKLDQFICTVTPHYGAQDENVILNTIRKTVATLFFSQTGHDLFSEETRPIPEQDYYIKLFNKRISYVLSTFDTNVPYASASMNSHLKIGDSITETKVNHMGLNWLFYTVPIHSGLPFNIGAHGNIMGSHFNNEWITSNRTEVLESMNHIVAQFNN